LVIKNKTLKFATSLTINNSIMTPKQELTLQRVRKKIKEIRNLLDEVMYYSDCPLEESIQKRVRRAYDLICSANDNL